MSLTLVMASSWTWDADRGNLVVLHASLIQTSEETTPAGLGLVGDLVVEIDLGDIDITGEVGFDELGGIGADDLAVGGVIGGVAASQEGGIALAGSCW